MKLLSFAAIVAGAGIAQVLAVPLLVIPKENSPTVVRVHFGHAIPNQVENGGQKMRKGPCRAGRLNQKAVEISNRFREAFGLPLINPHAHGSDFKILPFIGTPPTFVPVGGKEMEGDFKVNVSDSPEHHHHHHGKHPHGPHPHGHHGKKHHRCRGSFVNRIHHSLMNLGRWEGRVVAFVLGCGIGVLLRMFFVLGLVMYRAVRGQREEQHEYSQITIIEEVVDTPKSAPPSYTYPVDEKVPIVGPQPEFNLEFMKNPMPFEDFSRMQDFRTGPVDINFERDFAQWFNPDDVKPAKAPATTEGSK